MQVRFLSSVFLCKIRIRCGFFLLKICLVELEFLERVWLRGGSFDAFKNVEAMTHHAGVSEGLELANPARGIARWVLFNLLEDLIGVCGEVACLGGEVLGFESSISHFASELGEIDMGGDVFLAKVGEWVLVCSVIVEAT